MEPVTLAILTAVAGGAISAAPTFIKSDLEKDQEKRLKELRAKQASGV